jgi:hypothetical protein
MFSTATVHIIQTRIKSIEIQSGMTDTLSERYGDVLFKSVSNITAILTVDV